MIALPLKWGACYLQAEMIPRRDTFEPDPDNAGVGIFK